MLKQGVINYKRLGEAIEFYQKHMKYEYIEAPWLVSEEAVNVTKPEDCQNFSTFAGNLVASGEQSFIEMRDDLCPGRKYQCVTPCFRDDKTDEFHRTYFMKLELIIPIWKHDNPDQFVHNILMDAYSYFSMYSRCNVTVPGVKENIEFVDTPIGRDIYLYGIEVGSYGYRKYKDFGWVYGTGLAEPRLSQALKIAHDILDKEEEAICAQ